MRAIIFGATGMVGQGVLNACLRDDTITEILAIGRNPTGRAHPKLHEIHHKDFTDFTTISGQLADYDGCFYCLGNSSAGMTEADYRRISYDFPLAAAHAVLTMSPDITFCYVSGAGADSTGKTRMMWARVKGETENALLALTPRAYMFRPGLIVPLPGTTAKTAAYEILYRVLTPLSPLLRRLAPRHVTNSTDIGRAMIHTVLVRPARRTLTTADINNEAASRQSKQ